MNKDQIKDPIIEAIIELLQETDDISILDLIQKLLEKNS